MTTEHGPVYGVPLIDTLPLGAGGMLQAMPSLGDLRQVQRVNERVVAGYEVLLSHYAEKITQLENRDAEIRRTLSNVLSAVAKQHDAPVSAATHLDSAIVLLSRATSWRPENPELMEILTEAVEHVGKWER